MGEATAPWPWVSLLSEMYVELPLSSMGHIIMIMV